MSIGHLRRLSNIVDILKKQDNDAWIYKNEILEKLNKCSDCRKGIFEALKSTKTLQRDFEKLKKLGARIDSGPQGIQLTNKDWILSNLSLDQEEMRVSYLASALSGDLIPKEMRDKYKDSLSIHRAAGEDDDNLNKLLKAIDNQQLTVNIQKDIIEKMINAFLSNKIVKMSYDSLKSGEIMTRKVGIESFYIQEGGWYIRGYCFLRENARNFALHRIENPTILAEKFSPTEGIKKLLEKNKRETEDEIDNIVIKYDKVAGRLIEERNYFEGMSRNDEASLLTIARASKHTVRRWVLSMEGKVEVISPKELRDEVRKTAENLLQIHK